MNWSGFFKSDPAKVIKGKIHIPYISEENDDDDFEVRISLLDEFAKDKEALKFEDIIRSQSKAALKKKVPQILAKLRAGMQYVLILKTIRDFLLFSTSFLPISLVFISVFFLQNALKKRINKWHQIWN